MPCSAHLRRSGRFDASRASPATLRSQHCIRNAEATGLVLSRAVFGATRTPCPAISAPPATSPPFATRHANGDRAACLRIMSESVTVPDLAFRFSRSPVTRLLCYDDAPLLGQTRLRKALPHATFLNDPRRSVDTAAGAWSCVIARNGRPAVRARRERVRDAAPSHSLASASSIRITERKRSSRNCATSPTTRPDRRRTAPSRRAAAIALIRAPPGHRRRCCSSPRPVQYSTLRRPNPATAFSAVARACANGARIGDRRAPRRLIHVVSNRCSPSARPNHRAACSTGLHQALGVDFPPFRDLALDRPHVSPSTACADRGVSSRSRRGDVPSRYAAATLPRLQRRDVSAQQAARRRPAACKGSRPHDCA